MGYFSNGEAGRRYQAKYCDRCVHWPEDPDKGGCSVWLLHLIHNGEHGFLNTLIPRKPDGIGNEQCTMFHEDPSR